MVLRGIKVVLAFLLCGVALLLPYRVRVLYSQLVAWVAHAPFILFGRLARYMLKGLGLAGPYPRS